MRSAILVSLLFPLLVLAPAGTAHGAAAGLHVSGTSIVESNGNAFVMRGVSHAHTWYRSQTGAFADTKALGANTVRVVLSGGRWPPANDAADVRNVIDLCKQNRLICVLENHDTTGYGEQSGAFSLDQAVDYWISVQSALEGQEDYVVLNIGNEPFGNNPVTPGWADATSAAIQRLRDAGFDHLIMVDAPNWGQDWQGVMRDGAAAVAAADPDRNVVFSVHMYGVYDTSGEIVSYLDAFENAGLPLVIGEFGHLHSDGDPDENTIMAEAVRRGVGYIGWSWSGNSGGVEYLDMVEGFDRTRLTDWGRRIFNGPDGIAATAEEATIYGEETQQSLRELAAARGKFIGAALATGPLAGEAEYRDVAAAQFNQVTPENAMKWDATEPQPGQFTFSGADAIVDFAQQNGQQVHGHTLVWHNQTPGWVQDLTGEALRDAMENHIDGVAGRYASNPAVRSWDVVNEAFNEDGSLRDTFWLQGLGEDYIADAFRFARAADPDATLCINDYNVEGINAKSTAMYELVRSLRADGVPIDCVGLQGHLAIQFGFPGQVRENLQRFADLGVEVRVTELDVRMELPRDSAKDARQATFYRDVVEACLAVSRCPGVTLWGFTDKYSWVPDTFPGQGAALIYDEQYNTKPSYDAVEEALGGDEPPPEGDGCDAEYRLVNHWPRGFQGEVTISCAEAVQGWEVTLTYPADGDVQITNAWNSRVDGFTFANADWNGTIPAGGATSFGFTASWADPTGSGTPPDPDVSVSAPAG